MHLNLHETDLFIHLTWHSSSIFEDLQEVCRIFVIFCVAKLFRNNDKNNFASKCKYSEILKQYVKCWLNCWIHGFVSYSFSCITSKKVSPANLRTLEFESIPQLFKAVVKTIIPCKLERPGGMLVGTIPFMCQRPW